MHRGWGETLSLTGGRLDCDDCQLQDRPLLERTRDKTIRDRCFSSNRCGPWCFEVWLLMLDGEEIRTSPVPRRKPPLAGSIVTSVGPSLSPA